MADAPEVTVPSGADSTPSATPATATPVAPAQPATQATSAAPATGGESREGWVPSYRIRESREAAIREANESFSQKEANYRSQLEQVQRQLHALVGVQPTKNPEEQAVRDQFGQLYPGLNKLEQRAAELE